MHRSTMGEPETGFAVRSPAAASPRRDLLRIDSLSGLICGTLVLVAAPWLSGWYGVSQALVLFLGTVNLAFGVAAFALWTMQHRPPSLILALAFANLAWAASCLWLAIALFTPARSLGVLHLAAEVIYVGGLGVLELRHRAALLLRA